MDDSGHFLGDSDHVQYQTQDLDISFLNDVLS